jgi:hypothetical protein
VIRNNDDPIPLLRQIRDDNADPKPLLERRVRVSDVVAREEGTTTLTRCCCKSRPEGSALREALAETAATMNAAVEPR